MHYFVIALYQKEASVSNLLFTLGMFMLLSAFTGIVLYEELQVKNKTLKYSLIFIGALGFALAMLIGYFNGIL